MILNLERWVKGVVKFFLIVLVILWGTSTAQAQQCPPDKVCLDRDQAAKYLAFEDENVALKKEIAVRKQAEADFQKELASLRLELAKAIGEKTGSEQMVVRLTAIIDFMLKNGREKCYGLICIQ